MDYPPSTPPPLPISTVMFPITSQPPTTLPSVSPSPSPSPKHPSKGVKKFVKGVKRRLSLFGHHRHPSSGGDETPQRQRSISAFAAPEQTLETPPSPPSARKHGRYHLHIPRLASFSSFSSRKRRPSSDSLSQLSDAQTFASAEDSTLLSISLSHKDDSDIAPGVERVPLLSPIEEPPTMEVHPPPESESEDTRLEVEDVHLHLETEDESNPDAPGNPLEQPEVPDPFLVDDPDTPVSDEEPALALPSDEDDEDADSPPAEEIALAQSVTDLPLPSASASALATTEVHPLAPQPQEDKPVPPPPAEPASSSDAASSEEEREPPALHIPALTVPTMFLPIPNTDALSTLLAKYIPPDQRPRRDVTGEWQQSDYHTLVMTNSWRALARMARDRIVSTDPKDVSLLLNLWYIRLSSLARLRLYAQTNHEMANVFAVLSPPQPVVPPPGTDPTQPSAAIPSTTGSSLSSYTSLSSLNLAQNQHKSSLTQEEYEYIRDNLLPFELEVLRAKSKYWEGDHMGYLDELCSLLARCKRLAKKASRAGVKGKSPGRDEHAVLMWKERGSRVSLIMVSQLIEMKDFPAATTLLESLSSPSSSAYSPRLRSALARVHLQSGDLAAASRVISEVAQDPTAPKSLKATNDALSAAAEGDWAGVVTSLGEIVNSDEGGNNTEVEDKDKYIAINNTAVALLGQGHLKEGIQVLEGAMRSSPSTIVSAEPMLFNLSTLYELRSNTATEKKRELLVEVSKWAGDGLRTTCLKMPAT